MHRVGQSKDHSAISFKSTQIKMRHINQSYATALTKPLSYLYYILCNKYLIRYMQSDDITEDVTLLKNSVWSDLQID